MSFWKKPVGNLKAYYKRVESTPLVTDKNSVTCTCMHVSSFSPVFSFLLRPFAPKKKQLFLPDVRLKCNFQFKAALTRSSCCRSGPTRDLRYVT